MEATVDGLRTYLHLPIEEAAGLELYLEAAREKAKAAGIPDQAGNAHYTLFLYTLAGMYYDLRGMDLSELDANAQRMIDSFVLELRYPGERKT